MPLIHSLPKLEKDFPAFKFRSADEFRWSPEEMTIYYDEHSSDTATLLHELSHAVLAHTDYQKDIRLLELERDAWEYAHSTLAPIYGIVIEEEVMQDSLDTYRDWLHARSTCPECGATGIQTKQSSYKCLACTTSWRVNDARFCALRRYKTKNTP
jgi:hypothetical protein